MSKVLIIGGGPAGMIASIAAARNKHQVLLLEKNEKLGKKLYITGKGRCNITNACDMDELFQGIVTNRKFLYSSFYGFTNQDVIDFFQQAGLKTKVERGNRVFPLSDKSSDVIRTLEREMEKAGVEVRLRQTVRDVAALDGSFNHVLLENGEKIYGDQAVIATGGLSYPVTGSTGDGFSFGTRLGHTVTSLSPSLVPFNIKEAYVKDLMGLSLKNIEIVLKADKKEIYREFGEMLFTHFGVSGPVILSASCYAAPYIGKKNLTLAIDLKPALSFEQLDARVLREFEDFKNKQFKNSLERLLPRKLIPVIISLSGIDPEKKINLLTREERYSLVSLIKGLAITPESLRGYKEAIITRGGIKVSEVNPSTMESKLIRGIYFAGEALDLDGVTGGFNLQIAWSTGYAAGNSI